MSEEYKKSLMKHTKDELIEIIVKGEEFICELMADKEVFELEIESQNTIITDTEMHLYDTKRSLEQAESMVRSVMESWGD